MDIPELQTGDTERAANILNAIECITTAPRECLIVTVRDGWVRLEGTVPCWSQRDTVDEVVRHLPGVKGTVNMIHVAPDRSYPLN